LDVLPEVEARGHTGKVSANPASKTGSWGWEKARIAGNGKSSLQTCVQERENMLELHQTTLRKLTESGNNARAAESFFPICPLNARAAETAYPICPLPDNARAAESFFPICPL
jgi:hypothetical protein